jgi:hypothetical protein
MVVGIGRSRGWLRRIVRRSRGWLRLRSAWVLIGEHDDKIAGWVRDDVPARKMCELLERIGVFVPERTLNRYVVAKFPTAARSTVRVVDGLPGHELQVDFGELGLMFDEESGRRRKVWALVFTAAYSRHTFVWLSFSQTLATVIAGFEEAWVFFGGVFRVVIPDNMATIVTKANACDPTFNQAFVEYAQSRGFVIDPARVRSPQDKALVSHCTSWCRLGWDSFGESAAHVFDEPWVLGVWWFEEPFVLVVGFVGVEQPSAVPGFDCGAMHVESFGDFVVGEHAACS